jgi:hypothetical protein
MEGEDRPPRPVEGRPRLGLVQGRLQGVGTRLYESIGQTGRDRREHERFGGRSRARPVPARRGARYESRETAYSQGAPVKFSHPAEGSHITTNGICLIANGPHPNAAKVFVNWFFGKEGQMIYAPNQNAISVRRDVPQDYLAPGERYEEGQRFFAADAADQTPPRPEELLKLARETFIEGK